MPFVDQLSFFAKRTPSAMSATSSTSVPRPEDGVRGGAASWPAGPDRAEDGPICAASRPAAVFVHFVPPPLRTKEAKDRPWIVHSSCGCRVVRHVSFHGVSGFSTHEGAPPDQVCDCQIANHHLRGFGTVRWDGLDAIVENDAAAERDAVAALHVEARDKDAALRSALDEIRRLRAEGVTN